MPRQPIMGILQKALRKAAEETGNQEFARQAEGIAARLAESDPDRQADIATPSPVPTNAADDRTVLQPMDRATITEALDNPPQANERLKTAFERHGKTIISR